MAERMEDIILTHSQLNAGDVFYDLCCTPCSDKGLNTEASKYCASCQEYFCVKCVKNHNSFKALSKHVMVNPNVAKPSSSTSGGKFQEAPTELCKKHQLKLMDMYCKDDDVVGCSVCMTLEHRSCEHTHYIPEYVQSNFPAELVHQVNKILTTAIKAMKKLKTQHDRLDDNLEKSKATCKQEIQKYREDINQIIDKIEATTLTELDARHTDTRQKAADTHQHIQGIHDEMVRFKSEIESDGSNDSQKFVIAKLGQHSIMQGQELHSKLPSNQTSQLTFARNTDIMTFLSRIVTLGMLSSPVIQDSSLSTVTTSSHQPQQTQSSYSGHQPRRTQSSIISHQPRRIQSSTSSHQPRRTQSTTSGHQTRQTQYTTSTRQQDTTVAKAPLKQGIYKVSDKRTYNIQHPDDNNGTCNIGSSCILDNGDILLVDSKNKKLKLVDNRTYTIRSTLVLKCRPRSVCRVSSTEAAVCLYTTIQFVSTHGDKLVPVRSLSMKHICRSIAVIGDKVYACDGKSVYIYTLNGELVKTIRKHKSGLFSLSSKDIFSDIQDITVSDDERRIHVADEYSGVITLSTDGNVVWRYSGTQLFAVWGVCTAGNGNVIVCGCGSHNMIQLSPDGQYMGEIATHSDDVVDPRTVCYDRNNHKLIVGQEDNNNITVLTVQ